jgi:NAD(P)-dependent dehydrogenase (short-subunit alcohol dehydrogenase family)
MTQPRLAAVTGAAAGIGLAVARRLGAAGLRVALLDRDAAALAALPPEPWMAERSALDVSDPASIEATFTALAGRHGPVGVLVNNAGVAAVHPFLEHPLEAWSHVMATNVTGAFLCSQAAARQMAKAGWGRIVSIASISGVRASLDRAAYGTSKAAVIGLTRQMAVELARFGITANAVAPGATETEFVRRHHPPAVRAAFDAATPDGRYAAPEEIAEAVAFLASEAAAHINGVVLPVDGGFLAAGVLGDQRGA